MRKNYFIQTYHKGEKEMINHEIVSELESIVGERYISEDPEITYLYHYDFVTAEPEGKCDIAIMPE